MIAGVLIISASLTATAVTAFGFPLNVMVVTARLIKPLPYDLHLVAAGWFIIVCTLAVVVGLTVFTGRVTFHRIVGAVLLYLLIALAFVLFSVAWLSGAECLLRIRAERQSKAGEQLDLFQLCHTDDRRLWRYCANTPRCPQSMQSRVDYWSALSGDLARANWLAWKSRGDAVSAIVCRTVMRNVLAASILLVAMIFVASPAHAQNLPWCAIMDNDGTTQCNFFTQQQCLQTLSGIGGECSYQSGWKRAATSAHRTDFRKCARAVAPPIGESEVRHRDWMVGSSSAAQ